MFSYHSCLHFETVPTRPWRLGPWVWASNGHVLVALRDEGLDADVTPESRVKAARYLEETPTKLQAVSLPSLRGFAGVAPSPNDPCEQCHGSGFSDYSDAVVCEHCSQETRLPCEECGGGGGERLCIRYGRVAGVPVNLALLAYALTQVPHSDVAEIGSIPASGSHLVLMVLGVDWRIALMCCSDVALDAPSFPARLVEQPEAVNAIDPHDGVTPHVHARS